MNNIAICCIGYNRVDSMARLLQSLDNSFYDHPVMLIVSIDKSNTMFVKEFVDDFDWKHGEKRVILQPENLGLRKHVLTCGFYIEKFDLDAMIVLEDDISVSPYFYRYAETCVAKYQNDDRIVGISLYNFLINYQAISPFNPVHSEYDVYMMNCAMSWGQVWMKRQWRAFANWYEDNDAEFNVPYLPKAINSWRKTSWLKYHTRYCIEKNKYFIYPYQSLSTNNGDRGTHKGKTTDNYCHSNLQVLPINKYKLPDFDECEIKYDGFFEPQFLGKYLGVSNEDLIIDFYGDRTYFGKCRYVLSRQALPYKVVKSFALRYRPFEANIICNVVGNDIHLYDCSISDTTKKSVISEKEFYTYQYYNAFIRMFRVWGIGGVARHIVRAIILRICK